MSTKKELTLRLILQTGLLGGTIMFYFSIIGMVEAFDQRNLIGTFLTLGDVLLFTGVIGASFYLANQVSEKNTVKILGAGPYGISFLCRHVGRFRVVKALSGGTLSAEQVLAEAESLAQVESPFIAQIIDFGSTGTPQRLDPSEQGRVLPRLGI